MAPNANAPNRYVTVACHKCILASRSTYFDSTLTESSVDMIEMGLFHLYFNSRCRNTFDFPLHASHSKSWHSVVTVTHICFISRTDIVRSIAFCNWIISCSTFCLVRFQQCRTLRPHICLLQPPLRSPISRWYYEIQQNQINRRKRSTSTRIT